MSPATFYVQLGASSYCRVQAAVAVSCSLSSTSSRGQQHHPFSPLFFSFAILPSFFLLSLSLLFVTRFDVTNHCRFFSFIHPGAKPAGRLLDVLQPQQRETRGVVRKDEKISMALSGLFSIEFVAGDQSSAPFGQHWPRPSGKSAWAFPHILATRWKSVRAFPVKAL